MTAKKEIDGWKITDYMSIKDVMAERGDWTVSGCETSGVPGEFQLEIEYYDRGTCSVVVPDAVMNALGWVRK